MQDAKQVAAKTAGDPGSGQGAEFDDVRRGQGSVRVPQYPTLAYVDRVRVLPAG